MKAISIAFLIIMTLLTMLGFHTSFETKYLITLREETNYKRTEDIVLAIWDNAPRYELQNFNVLESLIKMAIEETFKGLAKSNKEVAAFLAESFNKKTTAKKRFKH